MSKKRINNMVDEINVAMKNVESIHRVRIEWAYGQPRAYCFDIEGPVGCVLGPLSPRLPKGQMLEWLTAYYRGLCDGMLLGG